MADNCYVINRLLIGIRDNAAESSRARQKIQHNIYVSELLFRHNYISKKCFNKSKELQPTLSYLLYIAFCYIWSYDSAWY